jgi:uncharacterized phage protein gp47/JayE
VPDILDFIPVINEDANTIRARIDADVNAGLSPTDPAYLDTTPGGFYWDLTQAWVLEIERLYDTIGTDYVAAMVPQYSWGDTLDEHGVTVGVDRNAAVAATGTVRFSGTDGALVATGTVVAVEQTDPDSDAVSFATTAGGTIASGHVDLPIVAVDPGAAGNVAAGQISILQSANPDVSAVTNAAATTGGADVETDEKLRVRVLLEWQVARGGGTIGDYERYGLDYPGVGFVKVIPNAYGPGTVRVIVTDPDNQPSGGTVVSGFQDQLDPPSVVTTLAADATLPTGTISLTSAAGWDPEGRALIEESGVFRVVSYTGVSGNDLTGCTGGSGTVHAGAVVSNVGRGSGLAPIGAVAVVTTPAATNVDVAASIVYETGFSEDGAGGTIAVGSDIEAAIRSYIDGLAPGDDVVRQHAMAQAFLVPGVLDITAMTLNTGGGPVSTNVAIDDDHVAATGTVTLT